MSSFITIILQSAIAAFVGAVVGFTIGYNYERFHKFLQTFPIGRQPIKHTANGKIRKPIR